MSSRSTPYDLTTIRGYPETLQLYRIEASRFWQVRLFVGRKYLRKSTKCESTADAINFAKSFFDDVKLAQRMNFDVHRDTFAACADKLMERQQALVGREERDGRLLSEDRKKLNKDILPFFGQKAVADITSQMIDDYVDQLSRERKLSPSTLNKHLVVIRKVLNEAKRREFLQSIPSISTVKRKDNPRPYFTFKEYRKLWETAEELGKQGIKVRGVPVTEEIYDFLEFHLSVYVRISDLKVLQHKHVQVFRQKKTRYVLITPVNSKTVNRASASMPKAVEVYERLLKRHKSLGYGEADDYVFFPQYRNRNYALQTIRRQFDYVVKEAGLKEDALGRKRTLYSLRHSALMIRLLTEKVDIYVLARNALTSVDQLERFYLSHSENTMNIENLQSYRS
ncbi:MAG: phage integrase SAM-like domain-containing protein [Anderseniella sp.]